MASEISIDGVVFKIKTTTPKSDSWSSCNGMIWGDETIYSWQIYINDKLIGESYKRYGTSDDYGPYSYGYDNVYFANNDIICIENGNKKTITINELLKDNLINNSDRRITKLLELADMSRVAYF